MELARLKVSCIRLSETVNFIVVFAAGYYNLVYLIKSNLALTLFAYRRSSLLVIVCKYIGPSSFSVMKFNVALLFIPC